MKLKKPPSRRKKKECKLGDVAFTGYMSKEEFQQKFPNAESITMKGRASDAIKLLVAEIVRRYSANGIKFQMQQNGYFEPIGCNNAEELAAEICKLFGK